MLEHLDIRKYSTTFEIAKLGQNILRHSVGEKRKRYMYRTIESESDVYRIIREQRYKATRLLFDNKTTARIHQPRSI